MPSVVGSSCLRGVWGRRIYDSSNNQSTPTTRVEVLDDVQDELAYTTVLTILQRLEDKGHVRHETEGKAHRYLPLLERGQVQDSAIQRMTRKLFRDSPGLLMTRLLGKGQLSRDQLRELRALVDERLQEVEEE